ncbi:hypothetical protein AVEN_134205-1 [Araneus ventricosus]|uniref:Retrovirus-related Pol polyprotein from transposon TNT 1-94-like beta-barrel domain-containing protein n=1 Tax=Araneus ventricosus TaxID=182803 RepID=A0A4Y2EPA4_ARAVE|nr:hypothetical protein AVEN_134205-1 [Araneus ventricosus]
MPEYLVCFQLIRKLPVEYDNLVQLLYRLEQRFPTYGTRTLGVREGLVRATTRIKNCVLLLPHQWTWKGGLLVDSAATPHFCKQREWFEDFQNLPPSYALIGDKNLNLRICGIGYIRFYVYSN